MALPSSFLTQPFCIAGLFVAALSLPLGARAQSTDANSLVPTPTRWRATYENWKLPGNETMGMLGGNVLFDLSEQTSLGIGTYGSLRGDRGGFITLGVAGEYRQPLSKSWTGRAGLFVGGGGGRGGSTLAGGGLMLRTDLGLIYESAGLGNFGFGVSHVKFPTGVIHSTQPYVLYEYPFQTLLAPAGSSLTSSGKGGPGTTAQEFSLVVRSYRIPAGVAQDDGLPQHPRLELMGVEWRSYLDPHWFLQLETEGAMGGKSNGYMQILAGGGYRWPITSSTALLVHAGAGPAGGGRVDTGGGLLVDTGVSLQQQLSQRTALELSLGRVAAPSRSFKANSLDLKLNYQFGVPSVSASAVPWNSLGAFDAQPLRMRVAEQSYVKGRANWRNGDVNQSVGNLGVQLDYFMTPNWFLTGQGLAAITGNAGAYMTGQVGAGGHWQATDRWFVEGEGLLGAAGGGGLTVGGGLVRQVNASIGYRLSKSLSVMATAGQVAAVRGDFGAHVIGASLVYDFTGFASRKP